MAFSLKQIQEIESIFQRLNKKDLNWKIVQTIPSILEKNTLYFLQSSINPKKFELYHTDKDGDLAKWNVYNIEKVDEFISELEKDIEKIRIATISGNNGFIYPSTTMPSGGWKKGFYEAGEAGVYSNIGMGDIDLSGKIVRFYYDGTTWSMSETPVSTIPEDGSVTPKKTSFAIEQIIYGKNRFDKSTVTDSKYVNAVTGELGENSSYVASDWIFIGDLQGANITFSPKLIHVSFYSEKNETSFISGREYGGETIQVPQEANWLRCSVFKGSMIDSYQIEEGGVATEYKIFQIPKKEIIIPFLKIEEIKLNDAIVNGSITPEKTSFAVETTLFYGKNRFDKTTVTQDFYVNAFNGRLYTNSSYVTSDWVFVGDLKGQNITFSPQLIHVAFYAEKNEASYISGREYGGETIQVPQSANWLRCSVYGDNVAVIDAYQIEAGNTATSYEAYQTPTSGVYIPNLVLPQLTPQAFAKILLPSVYYLAQGIEYNFYFSSFMVAPFAENLNNYYKSVFSYRGKFLQKKFNVTPTDDFSMIYKVENSEKAITKTTFALTALSTNGNSVNRKVLIIGDSTINNGTISKRISDYFASDVMDVTLLGTRQSQGVNHEGRSGWTMQNYIEDASVSGITNPFFDGTTFNFTHYLTTTSQTMGANDWVFIQLGINDLYPISLQDGSQTETAISNRINAVKARLEVFINSIKAYNSNIRIGIIQTFPPAISQDATGNLLQSALYSLEYYYKKGIAKWWEILLQEYDNEAKRNAKIYLIGANAVIDRENDFATALQNIDQYDSTQVEVQVDDVHPYDGYNQVGDMYIGAIKYFG